MVSTRSKITAGFVVMAIALWYVSGRVTENFALRYAILVGIGLVAPVIINEVRNHSP